MAKHAKRRQIEPRFRTGVSLMGALGKPLDDLLRPAPWNPAAR